MSTAQSKINSLTKDGLTGVSGFGVDGLAPLIWHVNASYASTKGKVFVSTKDMGWRRMSRVTAEKQGRSIIRCSYCKRPAISLDHSWPYLQEATHCAWHRNWRELANEMESKY